MALDEQGRSALWYAHHQGCPECAQVLLTAGVSPDYGMAPNQHIHDISEVGNYSLLYLLYIYSSGSDNGIVVE